MGFHLMTFCSGGRIQHLVAWYDYSSIHRWCSRALEEDRKSSFFWFSPSANWARVAHPGCCSRCDRRSRRNGGSSRWRVDDNLAKIAIAYRLVASVARPSMLSTGEVRFSFLPSNNTGIGKRAIVSSELPCQWLHCDVILIHTGEMGGTKSVDG